MRRKGIGTTRIIRTHGPLLALVAAMFAIFLCQWLFGEAWYDPLMLRPARLLDAWTSLREGGADMGDWREFATLLTAAFLHGDFEHVLYNMLFLWIFAALVAGLLGHRWMLLILFATAVAGGIVHTALNPGDSIPMLGASGAVMGFEGAYLGLAARWKLPDPHVWPMARPIPPAHLAVLAVLGVSFDYAAIMQGVEAGIAYGAHVGGFTAGLLLAALAAPRPRGSAGRR